MAKTTHIQIRVSSDIKDILSKKAIEAGFSNLSEYMLFVGLNAEIKVSIGKQQSKGQR